jgi:sporulation protein YlmC with PRC-barrel domain
MHHSSLVLLLAGVLLVAACIGPRAIAVYDASGERIGRVRVQVEGRATILDVRGRSVGSVHDDQVYDQFGKRIGRVNRLHHIFDAAGTRLGRVSEGRECRESSGEIVGRLARQTDAASAGGACLLLLLRKGEEAGDSLSPTTSPFSVPVR